MSSSSVPPRGPSRGEAWFCTTGLPSDVVFEVQDMSFHLHKFPLMSKSRKIHRMLTEQEEERPARQRRRGRSAGDNAAAAPAPETEIEEAEEEEDEEDEQQEQQVRMDDGKSYRVTFPDFPGGPGTFEAAAKFCYGVRVELTPWNVAPLRCAAEYMEMTEEHAEDNLAARAEAYLAQAVLRHPGEATKALKSCEELLPHAEELGIVARCVEAIAARSSAASSRSWSDDLAVLGLHMYKRVMAAMAAREDVRTTEAMESCLVSYAKATLPGLSRSMRWRRASAPVSSELEQRDLLEAVVASLPADKCSGRVVTAKFLFALLRTAHILRASDAARAALERKAATQLEQATLEDVLIPSYSGATETLYDVDCVERVVRHFLAEDVVGEDEASSSAAITEEEAARTTASRPSAVAMVQVGKLVDNYLAEVASDANLKPAKFCELALALPDHARVYDDGVYRAVDIYLKAHPRLTAEERDRVCGVVDCRKLTVEACTHAAQNERLPLRAVLQVLFFEQLQLRRAITATLLASTGAPRPQQQQRAAAGPSETWRTTAVQDSHVLRVDMDGMRSRVQGLERECSSMRRAIKKIDGRDDDAPGSPGSAGGATSSWRSRYGCKFSTQVCDSQARDAVVSRASRMGMSP
uniref:Uncharacterized protein n=2 Tax=Avena sativa TaxID=4498 RepID=A0ACD6A0D5_AVESA